MLSDAERGQQFVRNSMIVALAGALVACGDLADSPTGPWSRPVSSQVGVLRPVGPNPAPRFEPNTASDRLAAVIPGFGGAFVADDSLNILMLPDANSPRGQEAARTAVIELFARGGRPEIPTKFVPAKYSFAQLRSWENRLRTYFKRFGVQTAHIDERANRISMSFANLTGVESFRSLLPALDIPGDAVISVAGKPPVIPLTDLNDKVRPAGGGLHILALFSYGGVQYRKGCTYGFNAQIDGSTARYMVTNAHCVQPDNSFGGLTGATVAQPDAYVTSLVGYVTVNPAAQSGIPGCAAGDACRESDAVLVEADDFRFPLAAWDFGGIARTSYRGIGPNSGGSTTISGRIAIANASTIFFAGDVFEKIGARTGWTAGTVTATCVYVSVTGGGRMCNGVVAAGANRGDSGSPVFWQDSNGGYHLMGILWGGLNIWDGHNSDEFYFSRWQGIENDLSPYFSLLVAPSSGGSGCVPEAGGPPCPL